MVYGIDDRQTTVTVNALDEHGIPIKGLLLKDFELSSRKHEIQPVTLSFSEGPRRIVLLLDVSDSMSDAGGGRRWDVAGNAALEFVNSLPSGTQLALSTFATNVEETTAMSSDTHQVLALLNKVSANSKSKNRMGRRTALYDSIMAALKRLDPPQAGDAIVVITDGGENASKTRHSQVVDALHAQSSVRLFAWLLPDWPPDVEEVARGALVEMVNDSGGATMDISAPSFPANLSYGRGSLLVLDDRMKSLIKNSANALSSQISSFYLLTLKLPDNPAKPKGWKLEVVDERGRRRNNVTLAYPGHNDAIRLSPDHPIPGFSDIPQRGPN